MASMFPPSSVDMVASLIAQQIAKWEWPNENNNRTRISN